MKGSFRLFLSSPACPVARLAGSCYGRRRSRLPSWKNLSPMTRMNGPPESDPSAATRSEVEYVKLNNQFVVLVMEGAEIQSLVILSLSVEVAAGQAELVYAREPKLRDTFLRVLFDHANMGGFDGPFTQGGLWKAFDVDCAPPRGSRRHTGKRRPDP